MASWLCSEPEKRNSKSEGALLLSGKRTQLEAAAVRVQDGHVGASDRSVAGLRRVHVHPVLGAVSHRRSVQALLADHRRRLVAVGVEPFAVRVQMHALLRAVDHLGSISVRPVGEADKFA